MGKRYAKVVIPAHEIRIMSMNEWVRRDREETERRKKLWMQKSKDVEPLK